MKFKVGDRVVGNMASYYSITKPGWRGVVTKVDGRDFIHVKALPGNPGGADEYPVNPDCFDLVPNHTEHRVIVTTDGVTTLARLYEGKSVIKSAEAKCSPRDEFNFESGVALAVDRLLGRETKEAPTKLFPLDDIKAGYLLKVQYQDTEFFMTVIPSRPDGTLGCCGKEDWWNLSSFGPDLKYAGRRITAVYGPTFNGMLLANSPDDRKLLWSRD